MKREVQGFSVGGKAHRMLEAMKSCPRTIEGLYLVAEAESHNRRQKVRFIIRALEDADCLSCCDGIFTIKPAGRDLLDALDSPIPTVRVFATNQKESVR